MAVERLDAEKLYRRCEPDGFGFASTEELDELREPVGQPRAVEAVRFGVDIQREGYNLFALGEPGTGKRTLVRRFVEERARGCSVPPDWAYINNFEQPGEPRSLRLPAGIGSALRRDMQHLIERLPPALSSAFESEDYQTRRHAVEEEARERSEEAFEELQRQAQQRGLALLRTPVGWAFAPRQDGKVLSPEEFQQIPEERRSRLEADMDLLQKELQKVLGRMPRWEQEKEGKVRQLNREVSEYAVGHLIKELRERYAELPGVVEYLDEVRRDIVENVPGLIRPEQGAPTDGSEAASSFLRRYGVNALVDHGDATGAPVVFEDNPTHQNLLGRIEYMSRMGALITDFGMIRPGALHRANGGYLILEARKLLTQPYAWEGLKRALTSREIRLESLGQMLGLVSTVTLEPEPIPLDVKVILLGDRTLYYMLCELDPEFGELFKVAADFDDRVERTPDNQLTYARLIASLVRDHGLKHLDGAGTARIIEHLCRLAGDAQRISTRLDSLSDLLHEADYWASQNGNGLIGPAEIQRAIDAGIYRSDRVRERRREETLRQTILIDTSGEESGQVNGLSVMQLGGFSFGQPTRITARARMGRGEVVDIEREVKLGGPIHSKGVLILSAFLGARYAPEHPLSLAASLVFEQSYAGVEGDSASCAELYALLSAISGVPVKQSLAVTGSVNQHGRVQPIGGVNEKIEGFFEICAARGLSGEQGVLIPASNVKNLMLRADVIEAVRAGEFHVYPVQTVDDGIELLTGMPAGAPDGEGNYPDGSVNVLVQQRLTEFAEKGRRFARMAPGDEDEGG